VHDNKQNIKSGLLSTTKQDWGILHCASNGKEWEMKRCEKNVSMMLILFLFPNLNGPYNKNKIFPAALKKKKPPSSE